MGLFKNLFGKKAPELPPADLGASLLTDVHSHFIPGIDDGAPDMDTSLALISAMHDLGYRKVITTPHVMGDTYRNTPEDILGGLDKVRKAIASRGLDIEVDAAAEYYLDDSLEQKIKEKSLLTFGNNHVLFELPFIAEPPMLNSTVFEMQTAGYRPVLAHVERYPFWYRDWDKIEAMYDRGVVLQVNIGSLTGAYGPEARKVGEKLIDKAMVKVLSSDCHHMGHIEMLHRSRTMEYVHKALSLDLLNQKF